MTHRLFISNNLWLISYRNKKNYLLDGNQCLRLGCDFLLRLSAIRPGQMTTISELEVR
jgi:hypothetical protein